MAFKGSRKNAGKALNRNMKRKNKIKVIGLTGGIASGKSCALKEFKRLGANVIDADKISREVVKPGSKALKKIIKIFGKAFLKNKKLYRKKLAQLIFSDKKARKILEEITHPAIIAEIKKQIRVFSKTRNSLPIILDAPLLYEAGLKKLVNKTIVVWCSGKAQAARLLKRDKLKIREIRKRISAQLSLDKKKKLADFVLDNSSSVVALAARVRNLWSDLT